MSAGDSLATVVRRRMLGVGLIVVVIALLSLSVAIYNKAFTPVTMVTLLTDSTGNQLAAQSDVKLRGIIVGEVRSVSATGNGASIKLALDPSRTSMIPANVSAQLLPKTLFGERYVSLRLPSTPQGPIKAGDVIPQDRSSTSIAFEKVLNDLLPLLQAVRPGDLNATLTALAQALSGRGAELGQNLSALNAYLTQFNPYVPTLLDDLNKLGQVSDIFNQIAPDLLSFLNNIQTTSNTITANAAGLDALLQAGIGTASQLTSFFQQNGERIISVSSSSLPVLQTLAEYSPEYPCLAAGLARSEPLIEQTFGGQTSGPKALHITLEVVKARGKYVPGEQPNFDNVPGPNCQGIPNPPVPFPGGGYGAGAGAVGGPGSGAMPSVDRAALASAGVHVPSAADLAALNTVGSNAETRTIDALIASAYGTTPGKVPPIAALLAGPVLRGSQVTIK